MKNPVLSLIGTLGIPLTSLSGIPAPFLYETFDDLSGSIVGMVETVPGQIGNSYVFTREDANHVDLGDIEIADPRMESLSISFWLNPNQTSGGAFFPIGKGNRSSGTVGWSVFLENDVIIPRANYEGGGGDLRLGLNHPITVDEGWVHLVMVLDNEAGTFTAYYNGQPSGAGGDENGWSLGGGGGQTNTFEPRRLFAPEENLLVGRRSTEGAAFDGAIDDLALWSEVLTAEDVIQIYERGLAGLGIPSSDRIIAQSIPAKSVGNVASGNAFGLDFNVRAPVLLTDLGAFDSISDGFFQSPTVELWTRNESGTPDDPSDDAGGEIVATAMFSNDDPGRLEGGVRFKALEEPVILTPGAYTISGYGWGAGEDMSDGRQRGNTGVGTLAEVFQLEFIGSGRTGANGEYPVDAQSEGPPNLFGTGNFIVRLLVEDADGDGLEDGWERFHFGSLEEEPGGDKDSDGSSNAREFANESDPNQADTDGDGLNDGAEETAGSNPLLADTDGDGLTDGDEVNLHGSSPTQTDSDDDNFSDGVEVALETDPAKPDSRPDENAVFLAVSGRAWDDPTAWSDGHVPQAGKNYFVLAELAGTLISPEGGGTFSGDTLSLTGEGAELILNGNTTINNLTATNADLIHGSNGEISLNGNLQINDSLIIAFANANSTLELASTASGGALTVTSGTPGEFDTVTNTLRLTGSSNTLTGDVRLERVRVLAESAGSLGSGNLFLDNATLESSYNINTPSKLLDLLGEDARFHLNGQHVFRQINITGNPFITEAGVFDRDAFIAIDDVFETIFPEGGTGNLTIVGNSGDSDSDGLLDSWEIEHFGTLTAQNAGGDPDEDALDNAGEFAASSDPNVKDSDEDGLEDGLEVNIHGTSPAFADTDEDGLDDGEEIAENTDPLSADSDGDKLNDGDEIAANTDPTNPDTDGDGVDDGTEVELGGNPKDPNVTPNPLLAELLFYTPLDGDDLDLGAQSAVERGPNGFGGSIEGDAVQVEAGQIGQGPVFPGVETDFIAFTDEAINAGTEPFTVSFWFKVNVMQNAFMLSRGNRGSGNAGWSVWFENGILHTRANGVGLGGSDRVGKNRHGVEENQWYHVAFVLDREQNKMISYLNASTDEWNIGGGGGQTDNLVPNADFTAIEDLLIGTRTNGGFAFNGQIDDVAFWKRALNSEEIASIYNNGLAGRGVLAEDPMAPVDPDDDNDGDGASNAAEEIAGTDPNDPTDVLRILSIERTEAANVITWSSKAFKGYSVEFSWDLTQWEIVRGDERGTFPRSTFTDTNADRRDQPSGYYRVTTHPGIILD